jgi:DNA-binding transcriptional LysR family regulator
MKEYLIDAFLKVKKNNPKLTAEFISIDTGVAVSQVISGAIDFALVFRSIEHQDIDEEIVFEGNFYVAVKKGHPVLKQSLKKKIEALNELPATTFRTSVGVNFCERHPVFYDLGIKPNHQYFYDNNDTALKLIESTNGWALLPENVIEKYKSKISKVSLSKDWKVPVKISLIKNKYNKAPRLYQEILKKLKI